MEKKSEFRPNSPPDYPIPASPFTVDVCILNTYDRTSNTRLYLLPGALWKPTLHGFKSPQTPIYCFLISHEDRHIIFYLGVRTDWEKYTPKTVRAIKAATVVSDCTRDVVDILHDPADNHNVLGIPSSDIEAVVWSHPHFDHTGDPSRFPSTTELIVGPGVECSSWPGHTSNPDGLVLDSDAADRSVRGIHFDHGNPLRVGPFNAADYFDDGSFYLLDAPGHATGHLCGLARTTANPPTFVFMDAR
ncbi:hypothetical protein ABZX51_007253 [Aspergillus tubingensis]